jgi:hypothetical protein
LPDIELAIDCGHPITGHVWRAAGFMHTWCDVCDAPRVLRHKNPEDREPHTVLTVLRGTEIVCLAADLDAARRWIHEEVSGQHQTYPSHPYNSELSVDWYLEHKIFSIEEKEVYT